MASMQRHLDAYLQALRPPALVALAQAWGAPPSAPPHAALATILAVLNDPSRLQQRVASLRTQGQTALALVQVMGGMCDAEALTCTRASAVCSWVLRDATRCWRRDGS